MGLVTGLLTLPLAPVRGVVWLGEVLRDVADRERRDPQAIRQELAALAAALEAGELTPEQFDAAEEELLDRLDEAQLPPTFEGVGLEHP